MYKITAKEELDVRDFFMEVEAPHVTKSWKPGQFVVLLTHEKGERIPMSVYYADRETGRVGMFIRRHGKTSFDLWDNYHVGDELYAVAGPLGMPIEVKKYGTVVFVSDAVCGQAENYATLKAMKEAGNYTISIQSFEDKAHSYPEKFLAKPAADEYYLTTEDGSRGIKGHYIDILKKLLDEGRVDVIFGGGKLGSLKVLAELTKDYNIPTIVTVRQIMVDGTGMCGSCRILYDGEIKFACRDGPMFDAHKVDWDDVIRRDRRFLREEEIARQYYLKSKGVV